MAAENGAVGLAGPGRQSAGQDAGRSVGEQQQKVWDRVAAKNARFKAAPSTGTYREVLNQSGGDAHRSISPYVKKLEGSLPSSRFLVGIVGAVNGRVVAADTFSDPSLFRRLWPKLLRSYAADAAENLQGKGTVQAAPSADKAKTFLTTAADARSKLENRTEDSASLRLETATSVAYRLQSRPSDSGKAQSAGAIHTNILRK
jgi:hypothetical protein